MAEATMCAIRAESARLRHRVRAESSDRYGPTDRAAQSNGGAAATSHGVSTDGARILGLRYFRRLLYEPLRRTWKA